MRGNSFGKMFSMTSFGESHGKAIGVVLDGVPGGLDFSEEDLQALLDRRAPGKLAGTTSRKEPDKAEVLSGIFEGKTLGSPIAVIVENTNQKSQDYDKLKNENRAGHADETTMMKYGIRDHRGGGRSSGRETIARVIAGYFATLILPKITINAFISRMGDMVSEKGTCAYGDYYFAEKGRDEDIKKYLLSLKAKGESVGGTIKIVIDNVPTGLGEPAFDKLKADLGKGMLSIGACVSFSFGLGEEMASRFGSEVSEDRDFFGGIEGGISNGRKITLSLTFKPTSTVGKKAKAGRHDPCILPRALVVVESMARVVLADHFLRQRAYLL